MPYALFSQGNEMPERVRTACFAAQQDDSRGFATPSPPGSAFNIT
jgi:hypothetical protein